MLEILFFILISGGFFYLIRLNKEKDKDKIVVKESEAEKAPDQFNTYQGNDKEDEIKENLKKAERLLKAGANKNCEKVFLQVLKNDPKNKEAYKGLAKLYLNEGNPKEAVLSLEKIIALDEKDDAAWNNLGFVYSEMGKFSKSAYAYERAIEIDKTIPHRYINLAISLTKANDLEGAAKALEKAIKMNPEKETYEFLLNIYKKMGDLDKTELKKKL
ncbi:tetratricopeptide repeat protein [Patescibacteria group bacterium]|nr:tetratricopeptide repeat protein [Patescibacteria group bacterium]